MRNISQVMPCCRDSSEEPTPLRVAEVVHEEIAVALQPLDWGAKIGLERVAIGPPPSELLQRPDEGTNRPRERGRHVLDAVA